MLALRPNCELCDKDLPADAADAMICSYECTFCASCVDEILHNVCPNCGGGFVPRPIRPSTPWRDDTSFAHQQPSDQRRTLRWSRDEIDQFVARVRVVDAEAR